tara:strand:- start:112 stop:597 length:486 start_codon:yes stop_codon:yes gene_type:complete
MSDPNPNQRFADQRFKHPSPGLGAVGQYQLGGIPFVSSSIVVPPGGNEPIEIKFPYVTKFVTVQNTATGSEKPLRVGFSSIGVTGSYTSTYPLIDKNNFFVLDNGESYTGEFRVRSVYLLGANEAMPTRIALATTASIIAGLTGIPGEKLRNNWSGSSGVG